MRCVPLLLVSLAVATVGLLAQTPASPSFEVASVRVDPAVSRAEAGPPTIAMHPSGQFTALNVTIRHLILNAYDVRPFQIVDAPDWVSGQLFDIVAKAPDSFDMGQTSAMIRRLLEERFRLAVRRTTRAMPTYSLEWINKGRTPGPWLRRPSVVCDRAPADAPEVMVGPLGGRRMERPGGRHESTANAECPGFWGTDLVSGVATPWFWARRQQISAVLNPLGTLAGRPVIDKTGLPGIWDLDIKWDATSPTPDTSNNADSRFGSIFTAVREQLGLKLESVDAPVEVLVIDHVERPTEN